MSVNRLHPRAGGDWGRMSGLRRLANLLGSCRADGGRPHTQQRPQERRAQRPAMGRVQGGVAHLCEQPSDPHGGVGCRAPRREGGGSRVKFRAELFGLSRDGINFATSPISVTGYTNIGISQRGSGIRQNHFFRKELLKPDLLRCRSMMPEAFWGESLETDSPRLRCGAPSAG
jgi:hypothetical protein